MIKNKNVIIGSFCCFFFVEYVVCMWRTIHSKNRYYLFKHLMVHVMSREFQERCTIIIRHCCVIFLTYEVIIATLNSV